MNNCLNDLLGYNGSCAINANAPELLNNILGVDERSLNSTTTTNARSFAEWLIQQAQKDVYNDIVTLNLPSMQINNVINKENSACTLCYFSPNPYYLPIAALERGSSTKVDPTISNSPYSRLFIKSIKFRPMTAPASLVLYIREWVGNSAAITGNATITNIVAGQINDVELNYTTTLPRATRVDVFFNGTDVQLQPATCQITTANSGCGCGGGSPKTTTTKLTTENLGQNLTIVPCMLPVCDVDSIVCAFVKTHKGILARLLKAKAAYYYYANKYLTVRNNEYTMFSKEEDENAQRKFNSEYYGLLNGTKQQKGVAALLNDFFRTQKDGNVCIGCNSDKPMQAVWIKT